MGLADAARVPGSLPQALLLSPTFTPFQVLQKGQGPTRHLATYLRLS